MSVWLYISVTCDTVAEAESIKQKFIDAGLNPGSSRVNVAVGDHPHEEGSVL